MRFERILFKSICPSLVLSSCRFSGRLTTEEEPYDCVRTINHSEAHTQLQQAAPFTRKYNVPRYNQTSLEHGATAEVYGAFNTQPFRAYFIRAFV